jgi:diaminopimelate epimerase
MAKDICFVKMQGAGNDFIVVDNRAGIVAARARASRVWCDRKNSIGADGLLFLEKSKTADIKMRILNPDGSEAEMCGNGIRCIAKFAFDSKITKKKFTIQTLAGIIDVEIKGQIIKARMVDPKDFKIGFHLLVNDKSMSLNFVDTGVPHAVCLVKSVKDIEVDDLGRAIRQHDYFKPRGANVNFVRVCSDGTLEIRTYERGVEAETLACGTGSTAAALVSAAVYPIKSPVPVKTRGGEVLKVYFSKDGDRFYDVYLEGPVQKCFEGSVKL